MSFDKNLSKVLGSLTSTPKSTKTIAKDAGVSKSTTYRKIRKLKEKKLVSVSGFLDDNGNRHFLYRKVKVD